MSATLTALPLWRYRGLVRQLAARDLKARYKVAALGFLWSLLRPLLTIAVLAAVFSMVGIPSERYQVSYPILLMAAYLPWFFFSSALLEGTQSLLANGALVKKVYCPRAVYPAAVVVAQGVNFLLSMLVLIPLLYFVSPATPTLALFFLPLAIAGQIALLMGLCFAASALNVIYRDVTQIMEFLVFVWFYLSPVLYGLEIVDAQLGKGVWIYLLNPMAGLLEWQRYALLASQLNAGEEFAALNHAVFAYAIPYSVTISLMTLAFGYWILRKFESRAVDAL